jgi:putative ABC transport system permease protein
MRVPLLAGQLCREEANTFTMVVNRSFADRYLNGTATVGRHVIQPNNPYAVPAEIRGIVGDARETGLDREPVPTAYWCTATMQPYMSFLIRTHAEPNVMAQTVRLKIHQLEPRRSVYDLTPLTDHISDAYAENRLRTVLLAFFALTAIALASVGLYGTLSYLVHVRQREMAVRLALGASRIGVVRQILGEG